MRRLGPGDVVNWITAPNRWVFNVRHSVSSDYSTQ
jgi:hypothetical protein